MKRLTITLSLFVVLASLAAAGCITSPAPAPTLAPTVAPPTVTVPPTATPIGGSDAANIEFNYQIGTSSEYDGQKASPGYKFYMLQVRVASYDKPVSTSPEWFWVEFRENATAPVQDRAPFSTYMFKYPTKVIGPDTGTARGGLIFELPANLADGYPKPYYYMPLDKQQGAYKVYDKVYGMVGDIQ